MLTLSFLWSALLLNLQSCIVLKLQSNSIRVTIQVFYNIKLTTGLEVGKTMNLRYFVIILKEHNDQFIDQKIK